MLGIFAELSEFLGAPEVAEVDGVLIRDRGRFQTQIPFGNDKGRRSVG